MSEIKPRPSSELPRSVITKDVDETDAELLIGDPVLRDTSPARAICDRSAGEEVSRKLKGDPRSRVDVVLCEDTEELGDAARKAALVDWSLVWDKSDRELLLLNPSCPAATCPAVRSSRSA